MLAATMLLGGSPQKCFVPAVADFSLYNEVRPSTEVTCIPDHDMQMKMKFITL